MDKESLSRSIALGSVIGLVESVIDNPNTYVPPELEEALCHTLGEIYEMHQTHQKVHLRGTLPE